MAAAERDDGQGLVWSRDRWRSRDFHRFSIHVQIWLFDLPWSAKARSCGGGPLAASGRPVRSDPRNYLAVVLSETGNGPRVCRDRSLFRLDAGLAGYVA